MPAIATELHQTYSLILDDMMDEDELRRGGFGVNKKLKDFFISNFREDNYNGLLFNRKSSQFVVSYAAMLANLTNIFSKRALLNSDFSSEVKTKMLSITEKADEQIYHGQMMDILMEHKKNAGEADYLEMVKLKTASFFGMCFEIGVLLSGADDYKRHLFREFGMNSAISFQIQDDIIDILGDKGHELGSDIKKGKRTLLMIKALEKADDSQLRRLLHAFGDSHASDEEIKKTIGVMQDTGAIDYCKKLAMHYNNEAKEVLRKMKLDLYYSLLLSDMTDFMVKRSY
jgi:geranylgeranyl diphosphate synthase type I